MFSSINTDYRNDIHSWLEIEDQVRRIAEAGFTHVQWLHDWYGEYLYSPSEMLQARDILREYNLTAHTLHAPEGGERGFYDQGMWIPSPQIRTTKIRKDFTSTNPYLRLAGVDLIKNRIDLCSYIGSHTLVLHMQLPYETFRLNPQDKTDYYDAACRSFDELRAYAGAAGVRIALENLFFTPNEEEDEKFERLFNRYPADYMGLCYDSGHATLSCLDNFYYYLEKYHDRLLAVHLQDTDSIEPAMLEKLRKICEDALTGGAAVVPPELRGKLDSLGGLDAHRPPFTGVLDWDRIARGIANAPLLELPGDFEVVYRSASDGDETEWLQDVRKKAEKMQAMILQNKK
jgi:sugar phosphate isomerase/epimerase